MIKMNVYLNFALQSEEAFNFYKSVFGGEFISVSRFKDVPNLPGSEKMSEKELNGMMHIALQIGDNWLMATDAVESLGHKLVVGNNMYISLHPDTKEEGDRIFKALSEGGKVEMPMQDMFWGDYFGSFTDKYGVGWMINVAGKKH